MGNPIELTDKIFGNLTVLSCVGSINGLRKWKCICACGNITVVRTGALTSGNTKSCGCVKRNVLGLSTTKHGLHAHPLYETWKAVRQRCNNKKYKMYASYGGRGIKLAEEWNDFNNFVTYIDNYLGNRPSSKHSLDRKNNDGNYEPGNLRWTTSAEQHLNTSRNVLITFNGKTQTIKEWAVELNIKYATLRQRLQQYNWSVEQALTTPAQEKFGRVIRVEV